MAGISAKAGAKRASLDVRKDDLYQTPPEAVDALLSVENVPMKIWEPACGPGAIVSVLRASGRDVLATDLVEYNSPLQDRSGVDFLSPLTRKYVWEYGGGIVTNPPYKNAAEFVVRALEVAPYVAMLLRLGFLESERRRDVLDNSCLARVHVFRNRLPMMHREGWTGAQASSAMAFAWFIWDKSHKGPTELRRVSWGRA